MAALFHCALASVGPASGTMRRGTRLLKFFAKGVSMMKRTNEDNKRPTADEQRREMSVLAAAIHELNPWDHANCSGPFVCVREDYSQMFICNLVIDADGDRGFLIFTAPRDYKRCCVKHDSAREHMRNYIDMSYYGVFFSDWEKLPEVERKAYERLSIRFDDGCWPRFVRKRRGYTVAPLTSNGFETMEECLWHFREQLDDMCENGDLLEFEPDDIALRYYDAGTQEWKNVITPVEMMEDPGHPLVVYADAPILQSLKQLHVSKNVPELEVDYGWILPFFKEPPSGYEYEMQIVVVNRKTKEVLTEYRCAQTDFEQCMLTAVSDTMFKYGKPRKIYISRDECADVLGDLAGKLGIQLKQVDFLPGATNYLFCCKAV